MTGIVEANLHPLAQVDDLVVLYSRDLFQSGFGIQQGIERLHSLPAGTLALLVLPLGIALLNVGGVPQHNGQKLSGQASGNDLSLEAKLDQQGNSAGVINMSMGDQYIVDGVGDKIQGVIIMLVTPLLETAVNEDSLIADFQTVTAAGDCVCSAEKSNFHRWAFLSVEGYGYTFLS